MQRTESLRALLLNAFRRRTATPIRKQGGPLGRVIEQLEDRVVPSFTEFIDPNPNAGNRFGDSVVALSTGNVVITSPYDDFNGTNTGAVYLFNGATGALISTLRGSTTNDFVGTNGVTALSNGNYVVLSGYWNTGGANQVGAVTWGNGATGVSGVVGAANSLVGSTAGDYVGLDGVTALSNGNYVVRSHLWDNGAVAFAGAVTWGNGATGVSGVVSATNSLVGSTAGDCVGFDGVTALSNGNYVVRSTFWDNGATSDAGAVTWGSGATGVSGVVSAANSLVGSTAGNNVGAGGVTALSNGNYVVLSKDWDNGAGAVTWGSGATGVSGVVSATNSLVGSTAGDWVGFGGVTALSNGNYVVRSHLWDNGAVAIAGAVTWGNGATGVSGVVSATNSLVGSSAGDYVGFGGVTALSNGNYVVLSDDWNNGAAADAGAVTWGSGAQGVSGVVTAANSAVGLTANTGLQSPVLDNVNGNFFARFPREGGGVVRVGSQITGFASSAAADNFLVANPNTIQTLNVLANDAPAGGVVVLSATAIAPSGATLTQNTDGTFTFNSSLGGTTYTFDYTATGKQVEVTAGDGATEDYFGASVSVSGDTVVVGANGNDSSQGSAYVFVRVGSTWAQQAQLSAGDGAAFDQFGSSVSVSGDTVVVGANGDNDCQGSAYVFARTGSTWAQQAKLTASDGVALDQFGSSVAMAGDTVVVGAVFDDASQGSAYVFARTGSTWAQQAKLTASDGAAEDYFGASVSVSGDTVVVGAYFDDVDNPGYSIDRGSAYVFARTGSTWAQQAKLTASDGAAEDQFGFSVSVSGDTVVVGAIFDDSNNIAYTHGTGSAYVFVRTNAIWAQQAKLVASDGVVGDYFGWSVSVSGDTVVVGAVYDDIATNFDQGSAYVFVRTNAIWAQQEQLLAGDGAGGDNFGWSVAVSGEMVVVGAYSTDIDNPYSIDRGSAYIQDIARSTATVTVTVINSTPTDLALSASAVNENLDSGATVGTFTTTDPDSGNTFTYALVAGAGDADNASFTISNNTLKTDAVFNFENKSTYSIRVRTTDQGGQTYEEAFTITVTDVVPKINVQGNGVSITDGDTTPDAADRTDFGSTTVTGGTIVRMFTIQNTGTNALNLTGTPIVSVSGTNMTDFTVASVPTSPVAAAGSTTFQVTFNPSAIGVRTATLTIASNDAELGTYDFVIQGSGVATPSEPPTVATGAGTPAQVNVLNPDGSIRLTIQPFGDYLGGTTTSSGDVNDDGLADIVVGAGAGATGGHVKVFDGTTGEEIYSFFAFDGFAGGVTVGAGDVTGDGVVDIVVGAGPGATGGHVKVFDGVTGAEIRSFFAFEGFSGGFTVGSGDVTGDGIADIVVGARAGTGGPHVKVFDGVTGAEIRSFFAFDVGFVGGVTVGVGDVNDDGIADIVVGAGPGAGSHVKVFDGDTGEELRSFFAFDSGFTGGVTVGVIDVNGDGVADIMVGAGPGAGPHVKAFDGVTGEELQSFFAFDEFSGGVFVG